MGKGSLRKTRCHRVTIGASAHSAGAVTVSFIVIFKMSLLATLSIIRIMGGVHDTNSRVSNESWKPARKRAGQIGSSADAQGSGSQQAFSGSANTCQENGREATGTGQKTRTKLDADLIKLSLALAFWPNHRLITGLSSVSRLSVQHEPKATPDRLRDHTRES